MGTNRKDAFENLERAVIVCPFMAVYSTHILTLHVCRGFPAWL